jgi:hypothetical protein
MNILNDNQTKLVENALTRLKAHHTQVVSQHYLDVDANETVQTSVEIIKQIDDLLSCFSIHSPLYILDENTDEKILADIFHAL